MMKPTSRGGSGGSGGQQPQQPSHPASLSRHDRLRQHVQAVENDRDDKPTIVCAEVPCKTCARRMVLKEGKPTSARADAPFEGKVVCARLIDAPPNTLCFVCDFLSEPCEPVDASIVEDVKELRSASWMVWDLPADDPERERLREVAARLKTGKRTVIPLLGSRRASQPATTRSAASATAPVASSSGSAGMEMGDGDEPGPVRRSGRDSRGRKN